MSCVIVFPTGLCRYYLCTLTRDGKYTTHVSKKLALKLTRRQAEGFIRRQLACNPAQPCPPYVEVS